MRQRSNLPAPGALAAVALLAAACARAPDAELHVPPRARVNVPAVLDGSRSGYIPGRPIVSWRWDTGDGSPVLTTAGPRSQHTWREAGTWQVTLWVTDGDGLEGRDVKELVVLERFADDDGGVMDGGTLDAGHDDAGSADAGLGFTCRNGTRDGDETDVDCGGSCCGCASAMRCASNADCATGLCSGGTCLGAAFGGPWVPLVNTSTFITPGGMVTGLLDENCEPDVVMESGVAGQFMVVQNPRTSRGTTRVDVLEPGAIRTSVALVDADGDGIRDVVAGIALLSELRVFRGRATGAFETPPVTGPLLEDRPFAGRMLAVSTPQGPVRLFTHTRATQALWGSVDGTLAPLSTTLVQVGPGGPVLAAAGDVDADGAQEVMVINAASSMGSMVALDGDVVRAFNTFLVPADVTHAMLADLDGDLVAEAVLLNPPGLHVFSANRMGLGTELVFFPMAGIPAALASADANGDGLNDLVLVRQDGGGLVFTLRGGQLEVLESFNACTEAAAAEAVDLSGDGMPELLVACGNGDLQVLERFLE